MGSEVKFKVGDYVRQVKKPDDGGDERFDIGDAVLDVTGFGPYCGGLRLRGRGGLAHNPSRFELVTPAAPEVPPEHPAVTKAKELRLAWSLHEHGLPALRAIEAVLAAGGIKCDTTPRFVSTDA